MGPSNGYFDYIQYCMLQNIAKTLHLLHFYEVKLLPYHEW